MFRNNNNTNPSIGGNGNQMMKMENDKWNNNPMNMAASGGNVGGNFSHKASTLSTDLRCYFECEQGFKKDYDLRLHIKLRHANEDENELRRAYQAAEEEIALTSRNASTYKCALCPKVLHDHGAFYCHVRKNHNMQWQDYKDKYGRCEVESAPFECKICGRVVKYARNTVHVHLKNVHGITWPKYLDRIRKMREGEAAEELPNIEFFQCKVCTSSVKFLFRAKHLKGVHKITEAEYVELFKDELVKDKWDQDMPMKDEDDEERDSGPLEMQQNYQRMQPIDRNTQFNAFKGPTLDTNPPAPEKRLSKPPKTDIQDKTNKNCSSCSIAFTSRRNFIEHCTTVHNMKFRTQSGATISAPTARPNNSLNTERTFEEDGIPQTRHTFTNQMLEQEGQTFGGSRNGYQ